MIGSPTQLIQENIQNGDMVLQEPHEASRELTFQSVAIVASAWIDQ